jgi:predicted DNA-binding transcriptional regulator YafY
MSDAARVLRLLANASATQRDLAAALDLSVREVQEAILDLRLAGHPIIGHADKRGMRLSDAADEVLACAISLRRRALTQFVTSRALRRTARRMQAADDAAARLTLWGAA